MINWKRDTITARWRYYRGICLQGLRKTTKISVGLTGSPMEIRTEPPFNTSLKSYHLSHGVITQMTTMWTFIGVFIMTSEGEQTERICSVHCMNLTASSSACDTDRHVIIRKSLDSSFNVLLLLILRWENHTLYRTFLLKDCHMVYDVT
jgi:hypothetical protein